MLLTISVTVIAAIMAFIFIFLIPVLLQARRAAHEAENLIDKDPRTSVLMRVRYLALFAVLVFANFPIMASA
jgi:hypothetical protein